MAANRYRTELDGSKKSEVTLTMFEGKAEVNEVVWSPWGTLTFSRNEAQLLVRELQAWLAASTSGSPA